MRKMLMSLMFISTAMIISGCGGSGGGSNSAPTKTYTTVSDLEYTNIDGEIHFNATGTSTQWIMRFSENYAGDYIIDDASLSVPDTATVCGLYPNSKYTYLCATATSSSYRSVSAFSIDQYGNVSGYFASSLVGDSADIAYRLEHPELADGYMTGYATQIKGSRSRSRIDDTITTIASDELSVISASITN